MKILHVNTADTSGGAAKAAYDLHKGLLALGLDSKMLVGYKFSEDKEIDGIWFNKFFLGRAFQFLIKKIEEQTGLQYLIQPFRGSFLRHPWVREANIIHLHNLHGNYFSFTILPALNRIAPLVWTLYDMWPMTGHCTYPEMYGCEVWKTGKGKCPSLFDYPPIKRDTEAYLWRKKKEVYAKTKMAFVGPSKWMCKIAKSSPLAKNFPVHYIAQGIKTDIFHPDNQKAARKELGIPEHASVVMISAFQNAPRKGLPYFLDALQFIKSQPHPFLLVVGSKGLLGEKASRFPKKEMGFIESPEEFNKCFVASDISVLPTLADNLPLTILDSLASGTPVVSFNVGGIPEAVIHMKTGYVAKYKDARDLAHGIDVLLGDPDLRKRMSSAGRELMVSTYTIKQQAKSYSKLYEQIVAHHRKHT